MAKQPTLGSLVDQMFEIRESERGLNAKLEVLKTQRKELEAEFVERCEKENTDIARGDSATASVSRSNVPVVKDWSKAYKYIKQHTAFHLLEKRMAAAAWREEVEGRKGRALPGVESFEQVRVNLKVLNK